MSDLGLGFDCASKHEINLVMSSIKDGDNNTLKDRIIYANPIKSIPDLQYAKSFGVKIMTFDNIHELVKIKRECDDAICILNRVGN